MPPIVFYKDRAIRGRGAGLSSGILVGRDESDYAGSLPGLKLWIDASALQIANGASVSLWPDRSGNAKHGVQATGAKQPTYRTAVVNSRPSVQFDGGDCIEVPNIDLTHTSAVTIYVVYTAALATTQVVYEFSTVIDSVTDGFLLFDGASTNGYLRGNVGDSSFQPTTSVGAVTPALAAFVLDKSKATDEVSGAVNNASSGTRPLNTNNTNAFGNHPSFVGARNSSSLFLTGHVCELALYDRAHDAATMTRWWQYAQAKWGL